MRHTLPLFAALFTSLILSPLARAQGSTDDLTALSLQALSPDEAQARPAIAALRAKGPAGLQALFSDYRAAIDRHRADPAKADAMWNRLAAALDAVAAQKDAWAANLYWYTDFDAARRAATASGKPILSLRLLGTLDTEFSCANSRFFRTVLYPNAAVGAALRDRFILHWQSHRPVPKLTIDFGDGRKIERTITGNSVHYVLTPDGRAVDVIPGLYGPAAFLRALENARPIALLSPDRPDSAAQLLAYHQQRLASLRQAWNSDLLLVGLPANPTPTTPNGPLVQPVDARQPHPPAIAAARIAVSKVAIEGRPIVAFAPARVTPANAADDATWARIAALHAPDATLDAASRAVIASKAVAANNLTAAKRKVEDPVTRMIRNFERTVAEDTVRNEYLFHGQVHEWFAAGQVPASLDDLNEKVYARLFLMPRSDPYLGLVPADVYTGLPADAVR